MKDRYICDIVPDMTTCSDNVEIMSLSLTLPFTRRIFLIDVYRPPSGNIDSFLDEMSDVLDSTLVFNNAEVNILGDFNIDYLNRRCTDTKNLFR